MSMIASTYTSNDLIIFNLSKYKMRRRQLYGIMIVSIAIIVVMIWLNTQAASQYFASYEQFEGKVQMENFWGNA